MNLGLRGFFSGLILMGLSGEVWAQGYGATAEVFTREAEGGNPHDEDSDAGPTNASALSNLAFGNSVAMAQAGASVNRLSARASAVGSGDFNTPLLSTATATWTDTLYFFRDGAPVTSGAVLVSAYVDGLITELGLGANATAAFILEVGSSADGLSFESSGTHSESLELTSTDDFTFGLPIRISLSVGSVDGIDPSTAEANFGSTAYVQSVAFLNDQGLPDPTVQITSASGYNYSVPEPATIGMGLTGLAGLLFATRRGIGAKRGALL